VRGEELDVAHEAVGDRAHAEVRAAEEGVVPARGEHAERAAGRGHRRHCAEKFRDLVCHRGRDERRGDARAADGDGVVDGGCMRGQIKCGLAGRGLPPPCA
jgi:hypothetical protein